MFTFNKLLIILSLICSCSPAIIASEAISKSFFNKNNDDDMQVIDLGISLDDSILLFTGYFQMFLKTFPFKSENTIKFNLNSSPYLEHTPLYIPELAIQDNNISGKDAILIHLSNEIYESIKKSDSRCRQMAIFFDSNPSLVKSLIHICTEKKCPTILISSTSTLISNTYPNNLKFSAPIDHELSGFASFITKQYIALKYINEAKK